MAGRVPLLSHPLPLVPLAIVTSHLPGSVRPIMALLQAMPETFTEWCPLTDRRVLAYLVRHAAVLGGGVEPTPEWDHERLFHPPDEQLPASRLMAGFPAPGDPALDELGDSPMWSAMLQANWSHYCERLPTTAAPRFYLEPAGHWMPRALVMAEMPYRSLLLARDPRSELAELWLQGRHTGVLPLRVTHVDTPLSLAEREANGTVRDRLADLARVEASDEQMCIRYEDVVEQPAATWHRLRRWLQLPECEAPPPTPTGHEWPPARWRAALPTSVDAVYRKRMASQMEALGYGL